MALPDAQIRVSLVAIPDAVISTLSGLYDVLNSFGMLAAYDNSLGGRQPFEVEIVGPDGGPVLLASGLSIETHRAISEVRSADVVIVPSVVVAAGGWDHGRYPELVNWLAEMHGRGATLCSACSGVFLLAETGLFDGRETTVHWGYANEFRRAFPRVPISPQRALIATGEREQFVSSGAATSWHDMALYLIARYVGATAAQTAAKFFALEWHSDGLGPYVVFDVPTDHDDAIVADAQTWLNDHFSVGSPVDEIVRRSGLPARTFARRFGAATGHTPIAYVQRLRIEEAKRRLERTDAPIDEVGWKVGYEEPAFFRRLFKRIVGVTPGAYRKKFQFTDYSRHQN